jgi:hypothetical protein
MNNTTVDGGSVWSYYDAFITKTGEVHAHLQTSTNDLVLLRTPSTVALKAGATLRTGANFDFLNLIPGARGDAFPALAAGGSAVSVLQVSSRGLEPLYSAGQRVVPDTSSWNLSNAVRNAAGDLYFTNGAGIFRNVRGKIETLQRPQATVASAIAAGYFYKLQWFQGYYHGAQTLAVNQNGTVVSLVQAERETVVLQTDGNKSAVLAALGGPSPTPSPAGGFFNNWIWGAALAIDEAGRVMLGATDRNGNQGLFILESGKWRTAAFVNKTEIDGRAVTGISFLQAAGNKFFAYFNQAGGDTVIAEFTADGTWKRLVGRGDVMPNGSETNFVWSRFDVNRNGDIACIVNMNSGQAILVRDKDGNSHFVYLTSHPDVETAPLVQFGNTSLDLRDDRRLYFTAIDSLDRHVLFLAEPKFQ